MHGIPQNYNKKLDVLFFQHSYEHASDTLGTWSDATGSMCGTKMGVVCFFGCFGSLFWMEPTKMWLVPSIHSSSRTLDWLPSGHIGIQVSFHLWPNQPLKKWILSPWHALTTLHDPCRLQKTLTLFAETPPVAGSIGDRHRTESLCRSLLERMLGYKLSIHTSVKKNEICTFSHLCVCKVRPRWLQNPTTKRNLELDMYNEEHCIAFA